MENETAASLHFPWSRDAKWRRVRKRSLNDSRAEKQETWKHEFRPGDVINLRNKRPPPKRNERQSRRWNLAAAWDCYIKPCGRARYPHRHSRTRRRCATITISRAGRGWRKREREEGREGTDGRDTIYRIIPLLKRGLPFRSACETARFHYFPLQPRGTAAAESNAAIRHAVIRLIWKCSTGFLERLPAREARVKRNELTVRDRSIVIL